jgi:hypothetical protein
MKDGTCSNYKVTASNVAPNTRQHSGVVHDTVQQEQRRSTCWSSVHRQHQSIVHCILAYQQQQQQQQCKRQCVSAAAAALSLLHKHTFSSRAVLHAG